MPAPFEHNFATFEPPSDFRTFDRNSGMRVLHVHAYLNCTDVESVYGEDWMAAGIFQALVPSELSDSAAALSALLTFHHVVPIKRLYCFDITVREPTGRELEPDFDIEDGDALVDLCGPVTKLLPAPNLGARPGWMFEPGP